MKWIVVHRDHVVTSSVIEANGPEEAAAIVSSEFSVDDERYRVEVFPIGEGRSFELWREIERRDDIWERSYTYRIRVAPASEEK